MLLRSVCYEPGRLCTPCGCAASRTIAAGQPIPYWTKSLPPGLGPEAHRAWARLSDSESATGEGRKNHALLRNADLSFIRCRSALMPAKTPLRQHHLLVARHTNLPGVQSYGVCQLARRAQVSRDPEPPGTPSAVSPFAPAPGAGCSWAPPFVADTAVSPDTRGRCSNDPYYRDGVEHGSKQKLVTPGKEHDATGTAVLGANECVPGSWI